MKTIPNIVIHQIHDVDEIITDNARFVAVDLEMFGQDKDKLHIPHGRFACLSLSLDNGNNYVIEDTVLLKGALEKINDLHWIIQNATYDIRQLRRFVKIEPRLIFDPMLVERVLWNGYYTNYGLADLARRYFGIHMEKDKYEQIRDQTISLVDLSRYAAGDTYMTLRVAQEQMKLLADRAECRRVYEVIDAPMIWVVLDMPPVRVDTEGWRTLAIENESKGRSIEAEIGLNVFSYGKVKEHLAQEYHLALANTEDETLAQYKHLPIIQKIREARSYRKASSTYGQKWLEDNTDEHGDVRCNWRVTGAATGRMSSDSPNLSNRVTLQ